MSKLSKAIKYQRRQKAEKRRLRLEKKMRKNILFSDTESEQEEPIKTKTVEFKSEPRIIREGDDIKESLERSKDDILKQIESMKKQGWFLFEIKSHTLNIEPIIN